MSSRFALTPWRALLFLALLANTQISDAAIAFVQSKNYSPNNSSLATLSATFASAQTAGNFIVVAVGWGTSSATVNSISDTKGNTYTLAVGPTVTSFGNAAIYYAKNIAAASAGGNIVTVTFSAAVPFPDIRIGEYSGISTTSPLDVTAVASGAGTLGDSGSATTTNANDLLIGSNWVSTGTSGPGTGYTQREISGWDGDILEDRIVSATGAYDATAPVSPTGNWIMQMAAFKAASTADTQAPTAPSGLQVSGTPTGSQINLSWTASTDNVGVTGYLVERCQGAGCSNFSQVGTPSGTTFSDTTLSASTSYSYRVRATDAATNLSGYSNTVTATTAAAGGTPIAFVQSKNYSPNNASMTSISATFASAQTAGNFNVVAIAWGPTNIAISSVTDTKGNTYTLAVGPTTSSAGAAAIYYAKNIAAAAAGANAIKVTFNGAAGYPDIRIGEYSGISTTSPLDVTAVATGTGTLGDSGFATTTNPSDLLIGANWVSTGTNAAGANYTQREISSYDGDILEDRIVSSAGAYNATAPVTPSGNWIMQMAAFKGVSSGLATPTGLTATAVSSNQINLSWTASSGATSYLIERCATSSCNYMQISTSATTSYNDTGLSPAINYSYRVRATDAAGNRSSYSNTSPASTQAAGAPHATSVKYIYDQAGRLTQVQYEGGANFAYTLDAAGNRLLVRSDIDAATPSVPTGLTATAASATQVNVSWTPSSDTGGSTLQGYQVFRDGTKLGTSRAPSYSDNTVAGSASYSYAVLAYDFAGNQSALSSAVSVCTPDITSPTVPGNVSASAPAWNNVTLSWSASSDPAPCAGGIGGYRVYRSDRGAAPIGTATASATSYSDTTTVGVTTYSYTVAAYDSAGNSSAQSSPPASVTTPPPPDTTPPSVPSGLSAVVVSPGQINLTWAASTDTGGCNSVAGYRIYGGGITSPTPSSSGTSYSDTAVSEVASYTYSVSAYDCAGNESARSSSVSVTTPISVPTVPPNLSGPASSGWTSGYFVSWGLSTAPGSSVAYYNLQRGVPFGAWGAVTRVNAPTRSVHISPISSGGSDDMYRVQACTARDSCSPYSPAIEVIVCAKAGCT